MLVVVEGHDLPGLRCNPDPSGQHYEQIHVGVCSRRKEALPVMPPRPWGVEGLVAGDAPRAQWTVEVRRRHTKHGVDFGGPFVRGNRGDRHIGLAWGQLIGGTFTLFRAAKLRLDTVDPGLVDQADTTGRVLVGRLGLTDAKGNPRCARVPDTDITWAVERSAG